MAERGLLHGALGEDPSVTEHRWSPPPSPAPSVSPVPSPLHLTVHPPSASIHHPSTHPSIHPPPVHHAPQLSSRHPIIQAPIHPLISPHIRPATILSIHSPIHPSTNHASTHPSTHLASSILLHHLSTLPSKFLKKNPAKGPADFHYQILNKLVNLRKSQFPHLIRQDVIW